MPSIYALKRKHKKLQEEYDLKSEELDRLRKAHTIETDPSDKFKYEKQIEQREEEQKQLEQELEKSEHQIEVILRGVEGPPFQWNYDTLPLDFSSKIEFLTQYFVGRQEAIERIDQFLQEHKSGYLAIVGEAGIGKSALLAHEVKKRGAVHHFVDDKQNSAKDEVFLRCIVEQLRQKYGFEFDERTPISVSEWNIYFQRWMKEISAEEQLVIFVDALDEAQLYGGSDSLLKYLPQELPENIYFILTSRPEFKKEDITFSDSITFERYDLPPLTQADIKAYLTQRFLPFLKEDQGEFSEIASILYQKSEGNPLYLYYLLQECDGENLTLEQVNQLPQGLTKFYEKQWKERIWIGDKATKDGRKQILCLLLILKEPPSEEMILELTGFDWAELQEYLTPLRRFMRSGERYEIFHDSFKNFIARQFKKTIPVYHEQLIGKLWNWQELEGTLARYALFCLPTHLLEAKQHEKLFMLAREPAFRQAQAQAFPDNLEPPLRTLQTALQGAADADNAARMSDFLLIHARQILESRQEFPLHALRNGSLKRAWELADLYEIELCVQWYLLLAWELKDTDQIEAAQETLIRLRKKVLPRLHGEADKNTAYLLAQLYEIDDQGFSDLYQKLVNGYGELCKALIQRKYFVVVLTIVRQIPDARLRIEVLRDLAVAQAQNGDIMTARATFTAAIEMTETIPRIKDGIWDKTARIDTLRDIAVAQAQIGDVTQSHATFTAAIKMMQDIEWVEDRGDDIFRDLALVQAQAGDVMTAIDKTGTIDKIPIRIHALRDIAIEQVQAGNIIEACKNFVSALATVQYIKRNHLKEIASAQVIIGERFEIIVKTLLRTFTVTVLSGPIRHYFILIFIGILRIAQYIFPALTIIEYLRSLGYLADKKTWVSLLCKRAILQKKTDDSDNVQKTFAIALKMAQRLKDKTDKEDGLREIAVTQAQTGNIPEAFNIVQRIEKKQNIADALRDIAAAQAQAGDVIAAHTTFEWAITIIQHITDVGKWGSASRDIASAQVCTGDAMAARAILASMIARTQFIEWQLARIDALRNIAAAQAWAGKITSAHKTFTEAASEIVVSIEDGKKQVNALKGVIIEQTKIGDTVGSREIMQRIKDKAERVGILQDIAVVQAQRGDATAAIKTLQYIKDETIRIETLRNIAVAQARTGDIETAFGTVQCIKDETSRIQALQNIAVIQVQTGDIPGAFKTIEQHIEQEWYQTDILRAIAMTQAQTGDTMTAFETAQRIRELYRVDTLLDIAIVQLQTGNMIGACVTLVVIIQELGKFPGRDRKKSLKWIEIFQDIAVAQAQVGKSAEARAILAEAIQITQCFKGESAQADPLRKIAITQAQTGDIPAALETVKCIQKGWDRVDALRKIAVAQAQAGDITRAFETIQNIELVRDRAEALRDIAVAQAQAGDNRGARRTFAMAIAMAKRIKYPWEIDVLQHFQMAELQAEVLQGIAIAQAQIGDTAAAIEVVQNIGEEWIQANTMGSIAIIQAQAGDTKAAIKTIQSIELASASPHILRDIAVLQAETGDIMAARKTFAIAIKQAQDDKLFMSKILQEIAVAQAQIGDTAPAIETTRSIDRARARAEALRDIAVAQAQAGDVMGAHMTFATAIDEVTQHMDDEERRAQTLKGIAVAQAKIGNVTDAFKTVQRIGDIWGYQNETLKEIAIMQAQTGDIPAAIETMWRLEGGKVAVLQKIGLALAQRGEVMEAHATLMAAIEEVQDIQWNIGRTDALREIGLALAQIGETIEAHVSLATAAETAKYIKDKDHHQWWKEHHHQAQWLYYDHRRWIVDTLDILLDIALVQAQIGDVTPMHTIFETVFKRAGHTRDETSKRNVLWNIIFFHAQTGESSRAITLSQYMKDEYQRAEVLKEIAAMQINRGNPDDAFRTADLILFNRNKHLIELAEIFWKKGDHDRFKRMLIPCADYLDAAYKMCGILAQMYPEQATAIAEVVISQKGITGGLDVN